MDTFPTLDHIWSADGSTILASSYRDSPLLPSGTVLDRPGFTSTPSEPASTMVALRIPATLNPEYLVEAGEGVAPLDPQDRHITLLYLGELSEKERTGLHTAVRRWLAGGDWSPLTGIPVGYGVFENDEDGRVLWMSWDIPGILEMQKDLEETLAGQGFPSGSSYDYLPHETLAYVDGEIGAIPPFPSGVDPHTFTSVIIGEGDRWTEYHFPTAMALRGNTSMSMVAALEAAAAGLEDATDEQLDALIAAGGADRNRGNAERLRRYWLRGPGAAKIKWGTPGDWYRCVAELSKHMGPRAKGYCFTGDTEYMTRGGRKTFRDTVGTTQQVLTRVPHANVKYAPDRYRSEWHRLGNFLDGYWAPATIESFGVQPVLTVRLRAFGRIIKTIRATPDHMWFAHPRGDLATTGLREYRTDQLLPGMRLASLRPNQDVVTGPMSSDAIVAGFIFGRTHRIARIKSILPSEVSEVQINGHVDRLGFMTEYFADHDIQWADRKVSKVGRFRDIPTWMTEPPKTDDIDYLRGWLAGFLAAFSLYDTSARRWMHSGRYEDLRRVQAIFELFGVVAHIKPSRLREAGDEEQHHLTYQKSTVNSDLLLKPEYQNDSHFFHPDVESKNSFVRWIVEAVEDHGEVEEVFCAVVPESETFTLSGNIFVHNCTLRHKEATRLYTGDMKHRILYGWGGKPGSYWAKVAKNNAINPETDNMFRSAITAGGDTVPDTQTIPFGNQGTLMMMLGSDGGTEVAFRIPMLLPEGIESGDGRTVESGAAELRDMPIPLLWQPIAMQGHDGSMIVGRIDRIERLENGLGNAIGVFDTSPIAREAIRLIEKKFLRGISADLDRFEGKIVGRGPSTTTAADQVPEEDENLVTPEKISIRKSRIMGATLVAKPAFQEAYIELLPQVEDGEHSETISDEAAAIAAEFSRLYESGALTTDPAGEIIPTPISAAGSVTPIREYAFPVYPPAAWFEDPKLTGPTHLTITDEGRIYGHIADWNTQHIGLDLGTKPPRSTPGYPYFRTGSLRTAEGTDVRVGQLTLTGGHAALHLNVQQTIRHYDDTKAAFCDVAAGEDAHGIWVAGSLRPDVTPATLRAIRAASPSGDWRPINGRLELVAICQVNVPGFPVAQVLVASGEVLAMVAAGSSSLTLNFLQDSVGLAASAANAKQRIMAPLENQALSAKARMASSRMRAKTTMSVSSPVTEFRTFTPQKRESLAKQGYALKDGSYPIVTVQDLKNAIKAYGRSRNADHAKVKKHIIKHAKRLGHPELVPVAWRADSVRAAVMTAGGVDADPRLMSLATGHAVSLEMGHLIPPDWLDASSQTTALVASLRVIRQKSWDESRVARDDIGRFRKIYYRLRQGGASEKPKVRAALRALKDAERAASEHGLEDRDSAVLARDLLTEVAMEGGVDERTQSELVESAQEMADLVHRFEIRGPDTEMSFDQLPTEIQNALARYVKHTSGLEERVESHFGPFVEGTSKRSVRDILNLLDRVIVDAQKYTHGYDAENV